MPSTSITYGESPEVDSALALSLISLIDSSDPIAVDSGQALFLPFGPSSVLITFKKGLDANLPASFTLAEPAFTTDTHRFFLGTGSGRVELPVLSAAGGIVPKHMTDAAADNDTIYYSTTAGKLVYKDSGGTVNPLY